MGELTHCILPNKYLISYQLGGFIQAEDSSTSKTHPAPLTNSSRLLPLPGLTLPAPRSLSNRHLQSSTFPLNSELTFL